MKLATWRPERLPVLLILLFAGASAAAQDGALASRPRARATRVGATVEATGTVSATDRLRARQWRRSAVRSAAPVDTPARSLFIYPPVGAAQALLSGPAAVTATRVGVDIFALAGSNQTPVDLVLPDGSRFRALADEITQRDEASFSWRGRLIGAAEEGEAVITVHRGQIAGLITLPHRLLELVPDARGAGMATLQQLDGSGFPRCGGGIAPAIRMAPAAEHAPAVAGEPSYIDLLVVYTPKARRAAGGRAQIEATIQSAVDVTNAAYRNSRVEQRAYLIHMEEVGYDETGIPMERQLDWLRTNGGVANLRRTFGADLVAMIVESPDFCGQGYVMRDVSPQFERLGFSVTHRPCAVGGRTLAHELGHNMGLEHDPLNGPPPAEASFPWSFGHFVRGNFHTVMAYWEPCGRGCIESGHFSNPDVAYRGHATGIEGHRDNARTLRRTAPVVERFRVGLADPPRDFSLLAAEDHAVLVSRAVYTLRWSQHPLAVGYHVYRTRDGGGLTRITAAPIAGTSFAETGPLGELGRGYAVSAMLENGRETRRTETLIAGAAQ